MKIGQSASKTDEARRYLRANHDTPHRTLAKIMHHDRPDLWPTIENARDDVRYAAGAHGGTHRQQAKKEGFSPSAQSKLAQELADVDCAIPDQLATPKTQHPMGVGERWLIMADAHIPEHDKGAIETAMEYGKKHGIKNLLLDGDMVEHSQTSVHGHDPEAPSIFAELKGLTGFIKYARQQFKGRIIYKAGNHEDNLKRYIWQQAPALAGLKCLEFDDLVGFKNYGIEYVDQRVTLTMGKLSIIHGHEYRGGSALFPAQWLLRKTRSCAATAHFHKSDTARGKTVVDAVLSCWSIGCLRSLSPLWCIKNEWNWGFADVESSKDGNFEFENKLILSRGEVVSA